MHSAAIFAALSVVPTITGLAIQSAPLKARAALTDWKYNGCWTDTAPRQLNGATYTSSSMTPSSCVTFCSTKGYNFAGVEYANECYCGYALKSASTLKQDTECNMSCSGDADQKCGAGNRMNVYTSNNPTQITTNPGPVGSGWSYKSCYTDSVYARTLSVKIEGLSSNNVATCTAACKSRGFKFAGVEWR